MNTHYDVPNGPGSTMRGNVLETAYGGLILAAVLLAGCTAPIGADRVTTRQAYAQVEASALRSGKPSADTVSILHRFDLDRLAAEHPDEAVRRLNEKALSTGERNILFALAEMSYVAADRIGRSLKPWDPRDARDFYLGSAVYAWLFLFGEEKDAPPSAFDRRFRAACDFYNYGLGLALMERRSTNGVVKLRDSRRRLPVGEIEIQLSRSNFPLNLESFDEVLLTDQFRVRGLSVRNREPGVGTPLICVKALHPEFQLRPCIPVTALLRGPGSLADLAAGNRVCSLELYPAFDGVTATIGKAQVPLEIDLTTYRAYTMNQSTIWKLGALDFLAPAERTPNQLILNQPFDPGRIPVVFVHGTFSSPVTWAEMANTLIADPVLRKRYQIWSFVYGSGNPLVQSIADLRSALTAEVQRLDTQGTNEALRQMVVIGHSQGGLLAKCTAVETGDRIWRLFSTNRFEDVIMSDSERAELRRLIFYEPLPFVKRVVFIATPHRGSYMAGEFVRRLGQRMVSLPGDLVSRGKNLLSFSQASEANKFFQGKMPTSLDGMSPKNPGLLAVAELPVAPSVKAHSIIPVVGDGDPRDGGKDGIVAYKSAHVDYVESEFIVRGKHTCLNQPAAIEEVRRILHEHLRGAEAEDQQAKAAALAKATLNPIAVQLSAQGGQTSLLTIHAANIPEETVAEIRELRQWLGLSPDATEFKLVSASIPADDRELAIRTRSIMHLLGIMAAQVEVPIEDVAQGRATPGVVDADQQDPPPIRLARILSSETKPAHSHVAVNYRDHWFWIEDEDLRSKRAFAFMMMLFTLMDSGDKQVPPVLTIPTQ